MRLAILGPISWRTPPRQYGAWETVVSNLTDGLVARGYDVTLFATGDSITEAALHAVSQKSYSEDQHLDAKVWEFLHISEVMERAAEFDLIHNNYDFMPLTYSRLIRTPMLTTIHGFALEQYRLAYRKYRDSHFVSISDADRDPFLPYLATVYNGLKMTEFTFVASPQQYLAFVGRIHRDKGVHHAIDVAERSGRKLIIAGIIQDEEYFATMIEPHLSKSIEFIGPVGPAERDTLLGNAWASLHMTTIPERFGLAIAESMATGTPVIGMDLGSVREVVADGESGFVVHSVGEAVDAVGRVAEIDRAACRARVENLFSIDSMTEGYLAVYRDLLGENVRPRFQATKVT
ncbi:MAG: glycosyltransferase family 4 protein [Chloroflexota bacterium]